MRLGLRFALRLPRPDILRQSLVQSRGGFAAARVFLHVLHGYNHRPPTPTIFLRLLIFAQNFGIIFYNLEEDIA